MKPRLTTTAQTLPNRTLCMVERIADSFNGEEKTVEPEG
jgi:hypothetical protein